VAFLATLSFWEKVPKIVTTLNSEVNFNKKISTKDRVVLAANILYY